MVSKLEGIARRVAGGDLGLRADLVDLASLLEGMVDDIDEGEVDIGEVVAMMKQMDFDIAVMGDELVGKWGKVSELIRKYLDDVVMEASRRGVVRRELGQRAKQLALKLRVMR